MNNQNGQIVAGAVFTVLLVIFAFIGLIALLKAIF